MTANHLSDAICTALSTAIGLGIATHDGTTSAEFEAAWNEYDAAVTEVFAAVHGCGADLAAVGVAVTGEAVASRG